MEQGDRRAQVDRRHGDRRMSEPFGGRRHGDRRRFSRRKIAGAGLLAAVALTAGRHQAKALMEPVEVLDPSVEVSADNFRLPAYDREALDPLIEQAAAEHNLSPDLVRAVIQTESQFNPLAVSPVGAAGLMQLMPTTAKRVGIENPFDPKQNLNGGVKYLSMMMERFKGNTALALAGYNAGPEKVKRHRGIPPYRETQGYVRKIQKLLADTDAAFSIPVAKKAPRRASTRASAARRGAPRVVVKRAALRSGTKASAARTRVSARSASRKATTTRKAPAQKSTRRTGAALRS